LPEAEAFLLKAQANARLGKPIEDVKEAVEIANGGGGMTIQELFEKVNKKRWTGNAMVKMGKGKYDSNGSIGNARRYVQWCGPKMPVAEALTEEKVAAFVEYCHDKPSPNSGSTLNRYIAALKILSTEAYKLKQLTAVPELPSFPEGQCRMRFFTTEEEKLIQHVTRQWGHDDIADWFAFLCDTGCRAGEANKVRWEAFQNGRVYLDGTITKNSTPRDLALTPRALAVVKRMRERNPHLHGPFAWTGSDTKRVRNLWGRLRGHFDWMGPDTVMYTFRHTCASWLVQRGVDLARVQIWMGHKNISMTQRYAKFAPKNMDELAAVLAMT
jgi:integrase